MVFQWSTAVDFVLIVRFLLNETSSSVMSVPSNVCVQCVLNEPKKRSYLLHALRNLQNLFPDHSVTYHRNTIQLKSTSQAC